jgi:soluble lytic murein transglycosylase-like protein
MDLLSALIQIESSGNPNAFNKATGARGLTQVTPIAWKDLQNHNPKTYGKLNYEKDIFKPEIAKQAANDYIKIITGYLKHYNLPTTTQNILWAYNAGIGNVRKNVMPEETRNYIKNITSLLK